jgi:hypothetical protein
LCCVPDYVSAFYKEKHHPSLHNSMEVPTQRYVRSSTEYKVFGCFLLYGLNNIESKLEIKLDSFQSELKSDLKSLESKLEIKLDSFQSELQSKEDSLESNL